MPRVRIPHVLPSALAALALCLAAGCDGEPQVNWKQRYEEAANRADSAESRVEKLEKKNKKLSEDLRSARSNLKASKQEQVELKSKLSSIRGRLNGRVRTLQEKLKSQRESTDEAQKKLQDLRAKLKKLRGALPETVERLTGTGQKLFDTGEYMAAEVMLRRAAELGSVTPPIAYALGYCRARVSDYEDARKWYQQAIKKLRAQDDPNKVLFAKALNNCGVACEELDEPQKARELYEEAISVQDRFPPAHFNLARLYRNKLEKPGEAVSHLRRHIALGGSRSAAAREAIREIQASQNRTSESQ